MSSSASRSVFISYAVADKTIAGKLRELLLERFDGEVWLRDFDLRGGDLIASALDFAVSESKWFIILVSTSSLEDGWLSTEADLASIRAIEDRDLRTIVAKLDNSDLPLHLQQAFAGKPTVDLSVARDLEAGLAQIVDYVEKTESTLSDGEVYVDRGSDADKFALLARRNRVVFILGRAGIGKSAFVSQSIAEKLRRHPLTIKITRGHSADLLARQILQKTHMPQPLGDDKITDQQLLALAIDGLRQRAGRFFLFLDNSEEGLDASNRPFPYLEDFLIRFLEADIKTHVVLATTRNPDYSASLAGSADVLPLERLPNRYIAECIELWMETPGEENHAAMIPQLDELVELSDGYPLAARMIATILKTKTPLQILSPQYKKRLQMKLAEHILRSIDQVVLNPLHQLMLQILAVVQEPMLVEDMLAVQELRRYSREEIHQARWELSDWFLIDQDGDLMYLHDFLEAYFRDSLNPEDTRLKSIAADYANYAFNWAMQLNTGLHKALNRDEPPNDQAVTLSNHLLRYALPADRLLRSVGDEVRAALLPIQVQGTIREMVFYFYQNERNYSKALRYAESWLRLNPSDLEILLYRVRCYRNLEDDSSLAKADKIIADLETRDRNRRFAQRICREKALIAEHRGDIETAEGYYRQGIREDSYSQNRYPENYIGLAQLLLRKMEDASYIAQQKRQEIATEAVKMLEEARELNPNFERYHLGIYVEALLQAGREDIAMPLLTEALEYKPDDPRLNYRMAEVLRKSEQYDAAAKYALRAIGLGAPKARFSLANIWYGQAVKLIEVGDVVSADEKLRMGLQVLAQFRPEFGRDQEVADGICAKLHRTAGDWERARAAVSKYANTDNPYTIYEQCKVDLHEAESAMSKAQYASALFATREAIRRLGSYGHHRELPEPLQELVTDVRAKELQLQRIVEA